MSSVTEEHSRFCANCGLPLQRRPLEDLANWRRRKHCDRQCAAAAQWKKRKGDPAMVKGMGEHIEPAKKLQRLAILAREPHVRAAGLLDFDAFLDGYDNDRTSVQQMQAGGSRPTLQGSQLVSWLVFATGTLG